MGRRDLARIDLARNRLDDKAEPVTPHPRSVPGGRRRVAGGPPLAPERLPMTKRDDTVWTLAVDVGGTGIKASVLDESGALLAPKVRVNTPVGEPPRALLRALARLTQTLPRFDRVSVGFPGAVAKSSISSLSRKPAPDTVTALP